MQNLVFHIFKRHRNSVFRTMSYLGISSPEYSNKCVYGTKDTDLQFCDHI